MLTVAGMLTRNKQAHNPVLALQNSEGEAFKMDAVKELLSLLAYIGLFIKDGSAQIPKEVKRSVKTRVEGDTLVFDLLEAWGTEAYNDEDKGLDLRDQLADTLNNLNNPDELYDKATTLVKMLRETERRRSLKGDQETFNTTYADVFDKALAFAANPMSENAFKNMQKIASRLHKDIGSLFLKSAEATLGDFSALVQEMLKARNKIVKRKGIEPLFALKEEKKAAKEAGLDAELSAYNKAETKVKDRINVALRRLADESPNNLISTDVAAKKLVAMGINIWPFHPDLKNIKGRITINQAGQLCTHDGKPLQGLTNNPNYKITFNKKYNPDAIKPTSYLAMRPADKMTDDFFQPQQPQHIYTLEDVVKRHAGKSEQVIENINKLDELKRKWRKLMSDEVDSEESLYPYLTEYLFQTASRVGDTAEGKNAEKASYGATSFRVSHILNLPSDPNTQPKKLKIKYPVKGAHNTQVFVLDSNDPDASPQDKKHIKMLISLIIALATIEGKNANSYVFSFGKRKLNVQKYNAWLKAHVSSSMTSHKFRHMRGTMLFQKKYKEIEAKLDSEVKAANTTVKKAAIVNNAVKDMATHVGELLGHVSGDQTTAATAIKNYILPYAISEIYAKYGVAPNSQINKAMNRDKGE